MSVREHFNIRSSRILVPTCPSILVDAERSTRLGNRFGIGPKYRDLVDHDASLHFNGGY